MKRKLIITICVFGLLLSGINAELRDEIEVYIFSGQSNMQGIGKIANIPTEYKNANPNAYFWNGKAFVKIVPGTTKTSYRKGELGPEIGFVYTMNKLRKEKKIYIIKYAASGQPLHYGMSNQAWAGDKPGPNRATFYPGKKPGDTNTGKLYKALKRNMDSALSYLKKAKAKYRIKGIVWMQGEADSKHERSAQEYAKSLKLLKKRIEQDTKSGDVPFVFGQALPHEPANKRFKFRKEVRASMKNADCKSGHKDSVKSMHMVSTDGYPLKKDTVHYNAEGQTKLGTAFAETMNKALK